MIRVVSVTPTAIERDSRTFKHAASLARFGYESIAYEGAASEMSSGSLPFKLITSTVAAAAEIELATSSAAEPEDAEGLCGATVEPEGMRFLPRRVSEALPDWLAAPLRRLLDLALRAAIPPLLLARYVGNSVRAYRELPKAELYCLHSYAQFVPVYARSLRHRRARYVYDAHDSYFEIYPEEPRGTARLRPWLFARLERYCVRRADRFTTVSEGVADLLERRFGRRPEVIRNCPDLRLDVMVETGVRDAAGVPPDAFLLVSVGNAKTGMTIEEGLRALALLPDSVHLAFVGGALEPFAARVEALGLERRAHLLPPVPPTQVTSFIEGADAAALLYYAITPNFQNALPNRFFHAVAAGLPQLYPPLTEIRTLAERYGLGIEIAPQDPESIAAGVRALSERPDELAKYRISAAKARDPLSWEREEKELARVVGGVAGSGR